MTDSISWETALHWAVSGLGAQAADAARRQLAVAPDDPHWWYVLGAALYFARMPGAADAAGRAASLSPDFHRAWWLWSLSLLREGQPGLAANAAYRAIQLQPEDWNYHIALSNALIEINPQLNYAQALASANEAVRLAPDEPDAHTAVGRVYYSVKLWGPATVAFEAALRLEPDNVAYRYNLAQVALNRNQTQQAADLSVGLLRERPDLKPAKRPFLVMARTYIIALTVWGVATLFFALYLIGTLLGNENPSVWGLAILLGVSLTALAGLTLVLLRRAPGGNGRAVWNAVREARWIPFVVVGVGIPVLPIVLDLVAGPRHLAIGLGMSLVGLVALAILSHVERYSYRAALTRDRTPDL